MWRNSGTAVSLVSEAFPKETTIKKLEKDSSFVSVGAPPTTLC
jgi:hypothetical protein